MTFIEELASLVVRIRNLRARIECAEDKDMALHDEEELILLLRRLEKMKGGKVKVERDIIHIRATVTRKKELVSKVF